jgi:hypothetical protein
MKRKNVFKTAGTAAVVVAIVLITSLRVRANEDNDRDESRVRRGLRIASATELRG